MKTLTETGLRKQAQRFADSISHASYDNEETQKTIQIFNSIVENDSVKIYVFFDDSIIGSVSNVKLIDKDGDIVAVTDRAFIKPREKGLYIAFKYKYAEMEVENIESL
ncbi:hypothetical protein SDC9_153148 [bioreactor metagenome]|uniref:Uncharacterized protein n=1 Tax=bioreactor metagenome TaxID=1076179 RepID=A0A645EZT1_9ZZZZ